MRPASPEHLARRFVGWWVQGHTCHLLLRSLHHDAQVVEYPGDGTVLVRVDAAAWLASESAAADPPPEPLDGAASATNGTRTARNGNTARRPRNRTSRTTTAPRAKTPATKNAAPPE